MEKSFGALWPFNPRLIAPMKNKPHSISPLICVAGKIPPWISNMVGDGECFKKSKVCLLYLSMDKTWDDFSAPGDLPWQPNSADHAVVVFYDKQPITSNVLLSWQHGIETEDLRAFRLLTRPVWLNNDADLTKWLKEEMTPLLIDETKVTSEPVGMSLGQYVSLTAGAKHSDTENEFLSLTFGSMQKAVEQLEGHRRRYASSIQIDDNEKANLLKVLEPAFAIKPKGNADPAEGAIAKYSDALKKLGLDAIRPDSIPRILITGETGVGKTLVARNLARVDSNGKRRYIRISIPEFAGKEEDFEFQMFGYRGGSYTGAPDSGDLGILLKHIGGVVFLDEIGDATPTMQAKLLAYLDDFQVRPRGAHTTLFAPTLIIAATNYVLEAKADFRKDLLMRFPVRTRIPSLDERKDWLPLILDTLLQSEKVNPHQVIADIGQVALTKLTQRSYKDGNFRMLENNLTEAIERARRQGRSFLVADDIAG